MRFNSPVRPSQNHHISIGIANPYLFVLGSRVKERIAQAKCCSPRFSTCFPYHTRLWSASQIFPSSSATIFTDLGHCMSVSIQRDDTHRCPKRVFANLWEAKSLFRNIFRVSSLSSRFCEEIPSMIPEIQGGGG